MPSVSGSGPTSLRIPPRDEAARWLHGREVAVSGRLAALTRDQLDALLARHGATRSRSVTRRTSLVVIGMAGLPLRSSGRVSSVLQRAAALQRSGCDVEIITEDEWLRRLGLRDEEATIRGRQTLDEVARLTKLPVARLQAWIRVGLVAPCDVVAGVPLYGFREITALQRLDELTRAGISARRLRRSVERLAAWLPDAAETLSRLDLLDLKRLVVRTEEGALIDAGGQRLFDFEEGPATPTLHYEAAPETDDEVFEAAVAAESAGRLDEAEEQYRTWLLKYGPAAVVCYNLANVLLSQGRAEAAAERFHQAVELDPDYIDAWANLAAALADCGRYPAAVAAAERALELDPHHAGALYNAADALDSQGRPAAAREYWRRYVRLDADSPWGEHARSRLQQRR